MFDRLATPKNIAWQAELLGIVLKMFQNIFYFISAKNVWQALFCDVAKRSNILLDKQITNVW